MAGFPFPFPTQGPSRRRTSSRQRPMFGVGGRGSSAGRSTSLGGGLKARLMIAVGLALFALISYYGNPGDVNQITGKSERVAMADEQQEMALGRQAAPKMVQQHGGASRNRADVARVNAIGQELLVAVDRWVQSKQSEVGNAVQLKNPYVFEFTLLADPNTINAFALPGGQVFITEALYNRLSTDGELAGVIGHEIGHVIERHGNERMAKQKLFTGLAQAGGAMGGSARMTQMMTQMLSMKYGRNDELESDGWGVELCAIAGYDPRAMIGVMKVLEEASPGGGPPEMMSTHPKPANRVQYIQQVIQEKFPNGLPPGLKP